MSDAIRAAQVRAAENLVVQDLIAMGLVAAPQDKAHPTPPAVQSLHYLIDKAIAAARFDQQVRTIESMEAASKARTKAIKAALATTAPLAAPVASNTTAEPAPIQPAGVEVERDAARYRWLRSGVRSRQGIVMKGGKRSIDQSSHRAMVEFDFWCSPEELDAAIDQALAAASQGDRGKT